jgi:hypothetical protein
VRADQLNEWYENNWDSFPNEALLDEPYWRRLRTIVDSLTRQGIPYEITFDNEGDRGYALVTTVPKITPTHTGGHMPAEVTVVKYVCAQCGAEDSDRVFAGTAASPALNCWSCGAGRKYLNVHDQVMNQVGMLPVAHQPKARRVAQGAQ